MKGREYIQEWERDEETMTMWYNSSTKRYEIEGFVEDKWNTWIFTDIYKANAYMERKGWR